MIFIVRRLDSNSTEILELPETHFLKKRKQMEYGDFRRFNSTLGLLEGREIARLTPSQRKKYYMNGGPAHTALFAEREFYRKINEKPIFLYAHEQPVLILSPEEYKGVIGTVTIIPGAETQIKSLIIPGTNSVGEVKLPSSDTTVLFEDEVEMLKNMEQENETNSQNDKFGSFEVFEYADAGGGRIRKSRKLRKRKFVSRKLKVRKVHKRRNTRRSRTRRTRNI